MMRFVLLMVAAIAALTILPTSPVHSAPLNNTPVKLPTSLDSPYKCPQLRSGTLVGPSSSQKPTSTLSDSPRTYNCLDVRQFDYFAVRNQYLYWDNQSHVVLTFVDKPHATRQEVIFISRHRLVIGVVAAPNTQIHDDFTPPNWKP